MKKVLVVTCAALTLVGVGIETGWVLKETTLKETVQCPTEDSCRPDYHGGKWYIVPVTP